MSVKLEMKTTSKEILNLLEQIANQLEVQGISKEEINEKINVVEKDIQEQIKSVQQQICQNIKNNVKNNPEMNIEQEEVLEDNSIVLTINL